MIAELLAVHLESCTTTAKTSFPQLQRYTRRRHSSVTSSHRCTILKLTTCRHEASRDLSVTAELLVC